METQELKLKQACAVLQMPSKELQNLVQFGVVRPRRREGMYLFDTNTLLAAKVASCLKEYLACIIHERKSFGVSSRVEGPLYSKDSSPVSFFYRGPSTPRPPDPGSPARAAFARDGVASRKRSGSEVRRGRFAQDDISKFMNNPGLGLRMA